MKPSDEKNYRDWLLREVMKKKKGVPFYAKGDGEAYDVDILMLMNHVQKQRPELMEKLLAGTVNAKNVSKEAVLDFLGKSEKGTIVKWRDSDGHDRLLINTGLGEKGGKRIMILADNLKGKDAKALQESIFQTILKNDIKAAYQKGTAKQVRSRGGEHSVVDVLQSSPVTDNSSSNFEQNYKALIREQGAGASPLNTAKLLVMSMNREDRSILSQSFTDGDTFIQKLAEWRNEALGISWESELTRAKPRTRSRAISLHSESEWER